MAHFPNPQLDCRAIMRCAVSRIKPNIALLRANCRNGTARSLGKGTADHAFGSCRRSSIQCTQGLRSMQKSALLILLALLTAVCFAQGDHVPAYNGGSAKADQAQILPKDQLWGDAFQYPYQTKAYLLAAKIPDVINQMPCYCYCERIGHNSLHSCFESTHGAHCGICMKELFYTYEQTKLKKTPAQIRAGIIKGEWKEVDLDSAAKNDE